MAGVRGVAIAPVKCKTVLPDPSDAAGMTLALIKTAYHL